MKQNKLFPALLVFAAILLVFGGCHRYYMTSSRNFDMHPAESFDTLKKDSRYFVLHSGTKAWHLINVTLSQDRKTLSGILGELPPNHQTTINNVKKKYKEPDVLNEVHFYFDDKDTLSAGDITLGLDRIQKVEVIEKDKKRTTGSYVLGALGYGLGTLAVVGIIIAATKSSCPFVSAYNNNQFALQGEIYGGAIYPQLAREDFMPLRIQRGDDGMLKLKISNELKERQYTDFADLMVITHNKSTQVLADEKGNLYSLSQPQSPLSARTGDHKDALPSLLKKDDNMLLHFDDSASSTGTNWVDLNFRNPNQSKGGKLILALKNTYWLDYLYGELAKNFGSYYATYVKKQNKKPAAEILQWVADQKIPLQVSIKSQSGWQQVTALTTIGPLATRQVVVPVDLTNCKDDKIEIRLSSGFMFWEIDYAAMDFSSDKNFQVTSLTPSSAIDETGKDVLELLRSKDGKYLEQPVPGNVVTLEYKSKPIDESKTQSYFLHTRGYYTHVRDFKGAPNVAFLKQFEKPGAFPVYSMQLYKQFSNTHMASMAKQ